MMSAPYSDRRCRRHSKELRFFAMQRLFSMFPAGVAGAALALLRVSAAAALLNYGVKYSCLEFRFWILLLLNVPVAALVLGVLTPYASGVCCLVEIAVVNRPGGHSTLPVLFAILNTACVGILGPGAYSLDARFFGRRIVEFSDNKDSDRP
jgi:hypothetical protein